MKKAPLFLPLVAMLLSALASCQSGGNGKTTEVVTVAGTEAETAAETQPETDAPVNPAEEAAAFDALVADIGGAAIENEKAIDAAYLTYWSLGEEVRTLVTQYDRLQDLRSELTKAYVVKEYKSTRIPHERLLIGAYVCCTVPDIVVETDERMRDMADCHIDFTWQAWNPEQHAKYGIGMFVWGPQIGLPAVVDTEEALRAQTAGFSGAPEAVWAVYSTDEPQQGSFEKLGMISPIMTEELIPGCGYIATLLPLSSFGYDAAYYDAYYMRRFAETVPSDFLCYDHYLYNDNGNKTRQLSGALDNLEIASRLCREFGRDFYVIVQANHSEKEPMINITADKMRFQAYSAIAYGAKSISWACWIKGWGMDNVLDDEGGKTQQYDRLKETNADLKALEPILMRYTGTSNLVAVGERCKTGYKLNSLYNGNRDFEKLDQTSLSEIAVGEKNAVLIGAFRKNIGKGEAFLFVNLDDIDGKKEFTETAAFKTVKPDAVVTAYVRGIPTLLTPDANGVYTVEIRGADAVFVTVE